MKVSYGIPGIPKPKINKEKFFDDISRTFNGIENHFIEHLWNLITKATLQKHGTMIVISEKAKEEADRLSEQSTVIKPQKISTDLMNVITSIDGAVLMDKNAICFAIGVILDGVATENGDPSRGARYNSAIRYLDYINSVFKHKTLIVIVSEDGYVDIIPNLKPRISKKKLYLKIEELKILSKLKTDERDNTFRKDFHRLMDWFVLHEFYLSPAECVEINSLNKSIQKTFDGIHIVYNELKPDENMDNSYFIE